MTGISRIRGEILALVAAVKYERDTEHSPDTFAEYWARECTYVIEIDGLTHGSEIRTREDLVAFNVANWERGAHGKGDSKQVHLAETAHIVELSSGLYRAIYNIVVFCPSVDGGMSLRSAIVHDDCVQEDGRWKIRARHMWMRRLN